MIRIILNIKNYSPFLKTVSGEVVVEHVDFRELESHGQVKPVINCNFNFKPNQKGYSNVKGVDHDTFEIIRPQIDIMINSYVRGMTLSPHDHSWIEDSLDKPLEVWLSEKRSQ